MEHTLTDIDASLLTKLLRGVVLPKDASSQELAESVEHLYASEFLDMTREALSLTTDGLTVIVTAAGLEVAAVITTAELRQTYYPLATGLALRRVLTGRRVIVGVSGPAGAGKSVLCAVLQKLYPLAVHVAVKCLQGWASAPNTPQSVSNVLDTFAVVVGVDGYHRSNSELRERGLQNFKGRPDTFDIPALLRDLEKLREAPSDVTLPSYSRILHEPVQGAIVVPAGASAVFVEGILLFTDHFKGALPLLDVAIWLEMPETVAKHRVNARKVAGGRSHEDVEEHYARVDAPNHRDMLCTREPTTISLYFRGDQGGMWLPYQVASPRP